jgi:hypothetical protein
MMDDVANAIAVLGVYFALMAVLAVGVEAVIGWFKIPIPWLQGKPSPSDVINEVRDWLPDEEDEEAKQQTTLARITALNKALVALGEMPLSVRTTPAKIAETVGIATTKYIEQERLRRAVIRLLAIVLGIGFAALFQLDTVELLSPIAETPFDQWKERVNPNSLHIAGLVLTGLAASAGSSFWHDQSARLRSLKDITESASVVAGKSES